MTTLYWQVLLWKLKAVRDHLRFAAQLDEIATLSIDVVKMYRPAPQDEVPRIRCTAPRVLPVRPGAMRWHGYRAPVPRWETVTR